MTLRRLVSLAVILAMSAGPVIAQQVRDGAKVVVDGVEETWRLVWQGAAKSACPATEIVTSVTCPCSGWAYGEQGKLSLVRDRKGFATERLDLGPFFAAGEPPPGTEEGMAVLQRWPEASDDLDRNERDDPKLAAEIAARPAPKILAFADYDRDGRATEFLLQVGALPCGKRQFMAVGVSGSGRLDVLRTAARPDRPLVMPRHVWDALARSPRPEPLLTWECDDHGSEVRTTLQPRAENGRLYAVARAFGCPSQGNDGKLVSEEAW